MTVQYSLVLVMDMRVENYHHISIIINHASSWDIFRKLYVVRKMLVIKIGRLIYFQNERLALAAVDIHCRYI